MTFPPADGRPIDQQHAEGIIKDYDPDRFIWPWWASMIPYPAHTRRFALWYFMMNKSAEAERRASAVRQGQDQTRQRGEKKVNFADVAGADEEKAELQEVVNS